ncbi:hypothetical protein [Streptomyces canus]|uniref:hypothetical protein n=1 Tax=Streptomyces canus TaxID=58343 RepID=UPI0038655DF0
MKMLDEAHNPARDGVGASPGPPPSTLGISQRTAERYLKGQIKQPRHELADEAHRRRQPRVRARAQQRAGSTGVITIETRARFGFTAAPAAPTTATSA